MALSGEVKLDAASTATSMNWSDRLPGKGARWLIRHPPVCRSRYLRDRRHRRRLPTRRSPASGTDKRTWKRGAIARLIMQAVFPRTSH